MAKAIVTSKEQTLPTTTANSAPTNLATINWGITNDKPEARVNPVTPFNAFTPFPVTMTIKNGQINMNGDSCNVVIKDSPVFCKPTKFARVLVGIPMDPNGVGVPLAIKQTKQENKGPKPKDTSIEAGMAMAVPNPAIPSIKPPKHQAINKTRIRLSLDTDVIICLMISMPFVSQHKLYVNTAAMMTKMIGHIAIRMPSSAALNT